MSNHRENAQRLAGLYRQRKSLQIELDHQGQDLDARTLAITPDAGWPGKNEGERKISRDKTVADDETCKLIAANITGLRDELAALEGEIDAWEAIRRGGEWDTRDGLKRAFTFHDEAESETHEPADAAFDVAPVKVIDDAGGPEVDELDPTSADIAEQAAMAEDEISF